MSFSGNAGSPGSFLSEEAIVPFVGSKESKYDSAGNLEFFSGNGAHVFGGNSESIRSVVVSMKDGLQGYGEPKVDSSLDDTGVLVTGVAEKNEHGLPVNFGPGRNKWTESDKYRTSVSVISKYKEVSQGVTEVVSMEVVDDNLEIYIKNLSSTAPTFLDIKVSYEHSISF